MRTSARVLLAALLSVFLSSSLLVAQASASTSYTPSSFAARLVTLLNATRQQHGLAPLKLASGTTTVAVGWTQHLGAAGHLSHNPDLQAQLEAHGSKDWTVLGENVGDSDTQDPDGLWDAYLASPEHRENVLTAKFRYLGNAVVFAGGRAWNTMDFVDAYAGAAPAAKPAPKAVVKAAPARVVSKPAPHRAVAPASRAARPAALPRSSRPSKPLVVTPVAKPAVEAASATAAVAPAAAAVTVPVAPMDRDRVLALAVAAMLAMLLGGAWVGVALPVRR